MSCQVLNKFLFIVWITVKLDNKWNFLLLGGEHLKSQRVLILLISIILLILVGCASIEDKLPQKEAEQLVIDKHTNANGTPTILSVEVKGNNYYIKWEKKSNFESGTDKVDKNGKVTIIEGQIS